MITPDSSKAWIDTTRYGGSWKGVSIWGDPGLYSFYLVYSDGEIFHLKNIRVNQSPNMTCTHSENESIVIEKNSALKKSSSIEGFKILSQKSGGSCG